MDKFLIVILSVGDLSNVIGSSSQYVHLNSPRYATKNQSILLNCTTLKVPVGNYAEFLVNGETYTSLQKHNLHCIVANKNINCEKSECQCSNNSLWYSFLYTSSENDKKINFKCVMIYNDVGRQSDEISTTILDIAGPILSSDKTFPLIAGIQTEIKCYASVADVQVQLGWDCKNLSDIQHKYHEATEYSSTFTFIPSAVFNGIICTCLLEIGDYISTASITLEVTNLPFLKLNEMIICNSTASTVISCEVFGELSTFGFFQWIHSFNGEQIRKINGTLVGNTSFLILNACGYKDAGSYICRAWNDYQGHIFVANRTTRVAVAGKPVIIKTYIKRELAVILEVSFYANPKAFKIQWYLVTAPIFNLTNHAEDVFEKNLEIVMFGKRVNIEAYFSNITLHKPINGRYIVIIENAYGKAKGEVELTIKGTTYKFTVVLWILSVGVFLLTVTTVFTGRYYSSRASSGNTVAIYHAAPAMENQMRIYDITGNQYEEYEEVEGVSDYLEVVSSSCENSISENSSRYEEVY